jgi:adenylosuccinate lyase
MLAGIQKLTFNEDLAKNELDRHWEILTEGMQTMLRSSGDTRGYEKLKSLARGQSVTSESIQKFIDVLEVDDEIKKKLRQLSPSLYLGIASDIVIQSLGENV